MLSAETGAAVVVTGLTAGGAGEDAVDVLAASGETQELRHPVSCGLGDVRGTGCAFSSSCAARLAEGVSLADAVRAAVFEQPVPAEASAVLAAFAAYLEQPSPPAKTPVPVATSKTIESASKNTTDLF